MSTWKSFIWAALITMTMGALVEIAEGVTGKGHCRSRDLIPDAAGALIGAVIVLLLIKLGWKRRPTWSLEFWRR
jgi:VanZ family protein